MPEIEFLPSGKKIAVSAKTSLLDACRAAGFDLPASCGGKGLCGKCRIRILRGPVPADGRQRELLGADEIAEGWRVSCVAEAGEDIVVEDPRRAEGVVLTEFRGRDPDGGQDFWERDVALPPPSASDQADDWTRLRTGLAPAVARSAPLELLASLPGRLRAWNFRCRAWGMGDELLGLDEAGGSGVPLGIAVDIGTTTLAAALCSLRDGRVLATASSANPQAKAGDDVISRIEYSLRGRSEKNELRTMMADALESLALSACRTAGASPERILLMSVSGNTVMQHFLMGLEAGSLAASPFIPALLEPRRLDPSEIGWSGAFRPKVFVSPGISAYVGGDIVAGLLAHDVRRLPGRTLFLDVGTNGEIVLALNGRLLACAAAAGPAFEGARIRQGMRAEPGAISGVRIGRGGEVEISTVGGGPARGICGTGLLDAAAELLSAGVIDEGGRMPFPEELGEECPEMPPELSSRVEADGDGVRFRLSDGDGGGVFLTQRDIREFQLAKGAVAAGAKVLLDLAGIEPGELDAVLLAGGFGNFLKAESAARTGLLPAGVPAEKIAAVGNAALAGSRLCLLSKKDRAEAERLARSVEYIELSGRGDFQAAFAEAMLFPAGNHVS